MSDLPIKSTLKAGGGYDAPWLTVDASDPDDMASKLKAIAGGEVPQLLIEAANALKAANNAAPMLAGGEAAAPKAVSSAPGWSKPAQQSQNGNGQKSFGQQHPEGKQCGVCGNVLEKKTTQNGKAKWQCPDWRWNNGNPNGHDMEWINN